MWDITSKQKAKIIPHKEPVWPRGKALEAGSKRASVRFLFVSPFSSKVVVCGHCFMTLFLTITETLKWLSSLPTLMQESFWWWQCNVRYSLPLPPPPESRSMPVPLRRQLGATRVQPVTEPRGSKTYFLSRWVSKYKESPKHSKRHSTQPNHNRISTFPSYHLHLSPFNCRFVASKIRVLSRKFVLFCIVILNQLSF